MSSFFRQPNMRGIRLSTRLAPALVLLTGFLLAGPGHADHTPNPSAVTVVGSLQDELGCPGDWQPDCAATHLAFDAEDDVWQGIFNLPAGDWEYKAPLNDSWDENYGANAVENGANIGLSLADGQDVKFFYDHKTHWVTDNVNSVIATLAGSFQSELGCPGDWDPSCLRAWLQDPDGDGIYVFETAGLPAGDYETKVAHDESWDENYGAGGVPNGANISFSVPEGVTLTFEYDSISHELTIDAGAGAGGYAIIHYFRDDGDYGDHTTGNFNDFWGLHLWGDGLATGEATEWPSPKPFLGEDEFGRFAWIALSSGGGPVNFIVHRGDAKDGTDADRQFNPAVTPEIWLRQDRPEIFASQSQAQGYARIRYHRDDGDYGDPNSADYNDYWGLHLWGDGLAPGEATDWLSPKPFDGVDDFGAYWQVAVSNPSQPLNFIIHRGDNKDPGPDQSIVPDQQPTAWIQSGDFEIYANRGAAEGYALLHYRRDIGDYGDTGSANYNDFWGMHVWDGAANPTGWTDPIRPLSFDLFGAVFRVELVPEAPELAYILHRGDEKDPGPDQFLNLVADGHEVWQLQGADVANPYILPVTGADAGNPGDIREQRAYWVDDSTIAWEVAENPANTYLLHYAPEGGLSATPEGIIGGTTIALTAGTLSAAAKARFPHLEGLPALKIEPGELAMVPEILRGQIAVSALDTDGKSVDATGLQIPGVLDELFTHEGALGVVFDGSAPGLRLWAPTAKNVTLHLFADADPFTVSFSMPMNRDLATGVWRIDGNSGWVGQYYLYEVEVFVPSTGQVEHNFVTDPYSLSLSADSARSQIVDLAAPGLMPAGWRMLSKPSLAQPEDISIYELHVRDFSIADSSVPEALRGTFAAFAEAGSDGMQHLSDLAGAGLTHVHLLPSFDFATVPEKRADQIEPDQAVLASYPPDSDQQQAAVTADKNQDGFNWGYDPWHYTVPEGSYASDPEGSARVREFREMVQGLNETGLRVVMDVVYNHTTAAGQNQKSVLDRVVPGYYHRLNATGGIETSSCCANTASEHNMMEKLMIDSVLTWAREYKVDGFRFDLMGHHSKANMLKLRAALDDLTMAQDGVDGSAIYLYGEGWNFGEVANNARFEQATQANMAGTGIGTFSDRLRDGVRGGSPFSDIQEQGFINGLGYDSNGSPQGDEFSRLLHTSDWVRVGLAGGLAGFMFADSNGNDVSGAQVDYFGQQAGYTADPQEHISYIAAHDNETLFDATQLKAPLVTSMADRVRIQNLGNSIVGLGQGVPFFHAGQDILRSKSMDRDSYDSGDWFNQIDWTLASTNWGHGLPVADKNQDKWPLMQPLLADSGLAPQQIDLVAASAHFQEILRIRNSSRLFRLGEASAIQDRLGFHNTGPGQIPGLIAMSLSDDEGSLDRLREEIVVLFNANDEPVVLPMTAPSMTGYRLHQVQGASIDPVVRSAYYDADAGALHVPGRTTAVFVAPRPASEQIELLIDDVNTLQDQGVLNEGRANALRSKLENVLSMLAKGKTKAAANQLGAFINQVEAFIAAGILEADQADSMIEAAMDAIATVES